MPSCVYPLHFLFAPQLVSCQTIHPLPNGGQFPVTHVNGVAQNDGLGEVLGEGLPPGHGGTVIVQTVGIAGLGEVGPIVAHLPEEWNTPGLS